MKRYDFVALGSGPAGVAAALQARKLGKSAAIIEKNPHRLGGTRLHYGTIPSKTMREEALGLQYVRSHLPDGVSVNLSDLIDRAKAVSRKGEMIIREQLRSNNIDLLPGYGSIISPNRIKIISDSGQEVEIAADYILIATGSTPRRPPEVKFDRKVVVDSDGIWSVKELPRTMSIFGAGIIGSEYACYFASLGVKVTLIDSRPRVMQHLDQEVTHELIAHMQSQGINFVLGQDMKTISNVAGKAVVELEKETIETELCFFAAGRVSSTSELGLETIGIRMNERGAIIVNDYYQTDVPSIYAAGDSIGPPGLVSTSMEQGRIATENAFAGSKRKLPNLFPIGMFTIPEMSSVGMSEEEVQAAGIDYVVGRARYEEVARGYIRGDAGLLKLVIEQNSQKILGIHIVGKDAANLLHIGQCFMLADLPFTGLLDSIVFSYPTLAEAYRVAAFNAINKLRHSNTLTGQPSTKITRDSDTAKEQEKQTISEAPSKQK